MTDPVALSIGIYSFTGQGKTESSRRLARGIAAVTGRRVVFVDCDSGRGLHYREMFPEQRYVDFRPPHNSLDYVALLEQYENEPVVLVIDNMTAEHDGEGGLLDTFERAQDGKESRNARAWGVAKAQHKKLVRTFVRVNRRVPIIVTWRAQEKVDWNAKDAQGRTSPQNQGEMPVGSRDMPYEMTATYLLPAGSRGAPCLNPIEKGERLMTKIPRWFDGIIKPGEKFREEHGEAMARWAFGAPKIAPSEYERLWSAVQGATAATIESIAAECKAALAAGKVKRGEATQLSKAVAAKREHLAGVVPPNDEPPPSPRLTEREPGAD